MTDFHKNWQFIENRQLFMLLNFACAKLANFEDFLNMLRGQFFRGHSVYTKKPNVAITCF